MAPFWLRSAHGVAGFGRTVFRFRFHYSYLKTIYVTGTQQTKVADPRRNRHQNRNMPESNLSKGIDTIIMLSMRMKQLARCHRRRLLHTRMLGSLSPCTGFPLFGSHLLIRKRKTVWRAAQICAYALYA